MGQCELLPAFEIPFFVNLDGIERERRAAAWHSSARTYFPGMSVHNMGLDPVRGSIAGSDLGAGRLWTVLSPPLHVNYDPQGVKNGDATLFSLMLQLTGSTLARQSRRASLLHEGEMCVIDGCVPFELTVEADLSRIVIIQMPRQMVLGRHPHLEHQTAEIFDPKKAGSSLLRSLLLNVLGCVHVLESDQCGAVLNSVIHMLGVSESRRLELEDSHTKRVSAALAYVEAHLAEPGLNASRIAQAQGLSRRRLDEIMVEAIGASVNSLIWARRLEQAASDLLSERLASRTIGDVAFAAGFEDVAHFTRAFRRRYLMPPGKWRREHASGSRKALRSTLTHRPN